MEDPLEFFREEPTQAVLTPKERPPDNPHFFRWLCYGEFALVSLIMFGIIAAVLYSIAWITCGWQPAVHLRIAEAAESLSKTWKIVLIILIPLFFRPLAKFLINLKKAHGWEAGEPAMGEESKVEGYGDTNLK